MKSPPVDAPLSIALAPSKTESGWRAWLPAILAALTAMVLYSVTLRGTYVYDDVILREDPRFTHRDLWIEFWTKPYWVEAVDKLYRPLTCLTFAEEYAIHGDRPWLYHLVNILLHAGVAAAVAELARRLFGFRVALAAGVLFAVHPVHVEAVAGLVGRAELLCTLFSVCAMILFLKPMTGRRVFAIAGLNLLAILSKEQGILLPGILLVMVPFRRSILAGGETPTPVSEVLRRAGFRWREIRLFGVPQRPASGSLMGSETVPQSNTLLTSDKMKLERGAMNGLVAALCLLTAAYLIFRENLLGFGWDRGELEWTINPLIRAVGLDRVWMPLVLLGRYLLLLIAPIRLSLDYGTHVIGWTVNWREPFVYLGAATVIGWMIVTIGAYRRRQFAVLFCLLALAITYGIVSNSVILIGTIMGERLMYLPSVFFVIPLSALLARWLRPGWFTIVIVLLALLGSIRSFTYARLWNDPLKLCLADLQNHPKSMHLHSLCVDQYLARGDYIAARAIGEDSIMRLPDCWESYRMCVVADLKMHDFADAERVLTHVDRRCPGLKIVGMQEQVRQARAQYEKVARAARP